MYHWIGVIRIPIMMSIPAIVTTRRHVQKHVLLLVAVDIGSSYSTQHPPDSPLQGGCTVSAGLFYASIYDKYYY